MATAVGLFVAIPAVVAYNLFERKVRTQDGAGRFARTLGAGERADRITAGRAVIGRRRRYTAEGRLMAGSISSGSRLRRRCRADERHQRHAAGGRDARAVDRVHDHRAGDRRQRAGEGRLARVDGDRPGRSEQSPLVFSLKRGASGELELYLNEQPHRRSGRPQVISRSGRA